MSDDIIKIKIDPGKAEFDRLDDYIERTINRMETLIQRTAELNRAVKVAGNVPAMDKFQKALEMENRALDEQFKRMHRLGTYLDKQDFDRRKNAKSINEETAAIQNQTAAFESRAQKITHTEKKLALPAPTARLALPAPTAADYRASATNYTDLASKNKQEMRSLFDKLFTEAKNRLNATVDRMRAEAKYTDPNAMGKPKYLYGTSGLDDEMDYPKDSHVNPNEFFKTAENYNESLGKSTKATRLSAETLDAATIKSNKYKEALHRIDVAAEKRLELADYSDAPEAEKVAAARQYDKLNAVADGFEAKLKEMGKFEEYQEESKVRKQKDTGGYDPVKDRADFDAEIAQRAENRAKGFNQVVSSTGEQLDKTGKRVNGIGKSFDDTSKKIERGAGFFNSWFAKWSIAMSGIAATIFVFQQLKQAVQTFIDWTTKFDEGVAAITTGRSLGANGSSEKVEQFLSNASAKIPFATPEQIARATELMQAHGEKSVNIQQVKEIVGIANSKMLGYEGGGDVEKAFNLWKHQSDSETAKILKQFAENRESQSDSQVNLAYRGVEKFFRDFWDYNAAGHMAIATGSSNVNQEMEAWNRVFQNVADSQRAGALASAAPYSDRAMNALEESKKPEKQNQVTSVKDIPDKAFKQWEQIMDSVSIDRIDLTPDRGSIGDRTSKAAQDLARDTGYHTAPYVEDIKANTKETYDNEDLRKRFGDKIIDQAIKDLNAATQQSAEKANLLAPILSPIELQRQQAIEAQTGRMPESLYQYKDTEAKFDIKDQLGLLKALKRNWETFMSGRLASDQEYFDSTGMMSDKLFQFNEEKIFKTERIMAAAGMSEDDRHDYLTSATGVLGAQKNKRQFDAEQGIFEKTGIVSDQLALFMEAEISRAMNSLEPFNLEPETKAAYQEELNREKQRETDKFRRSANENMFDLVGYTSPEYKKFAAENIEDQISNMKEKGGIKDPALLDRARKELEFQQGRKENAARIEFEESYVYEVRKMNDWLYGQKLLMIEHDRKKYEDAGYDKVQIEELITERIKQLDIDKEYSNRKWTGGVRRALDSIIKDTENMAYQSESLVMNAASNMENAFVNLATTGKWSFSDMINSMIADLARLVTQQSIINPFFSGVESALPSALSWLGLGGGGSGGSSALTTNDWAKFYGAPGSAHGNIFNQTGLRTFAAGGMFANQIVSQPTYFKYGGSGLGVMGEAGPEAILPLTRTPSGDLGVKTAGNSASSTPSNVAVEVNVINQTDQGVTAKQSGEPKWNGNKMSVDIVMTALNNRTVQKQIVGLRG